MNGMTDLQTAFDAFITPYHGDVLFDEPLAAHCSFKIGGPAEIFFTPYDEEALLAALRYAKENGVRLHILGNGSNVLISEKGLGGVTVRLMGGLTALEKRADGSVFCGAGVSLKRLCTFALENGLTGLEFAYGIPGSVGGAVYMNAGAYGGEIKNVLQKVRCVDPATLETKEYEASSLDISYRSTPFMKNKEIITGAVFSLSAGDPAEIRGKMNELMGRRKASQPLEYPSAGSTFKRPPNGYAAAMIDQSGLKGYRVGGAMVSEKHAGFVINRRNATFRNVMDVIEGVRNTVEQKFGTRLELEVEILGEE